MEINAVIDNNLEKIRQEKKLTLGELAGVAGVSKGMLLQIEKRTASPTINIIRKISNGLDVPYTYLLEDDYVRENPVVKKTETVIQRSEGHSYRVFDYYSDNQERNFELFWPELDPEKKYQAVGHSEHSIEYVMAIQGALALEVGSQRYLLPRDAAVYSGANQVHTYIDDGTEEVQAVVIDYYAQQWRINIRKLLHPLFYGQKK